MKVVKKEWKGEEGEDNWSISAFKIFFYIYIVFFQGGIFSWVGPPSNNLHNLACATFLYRSRTKVVLPYPDNLSWFGKKNEFNHSNFLFFWELSAYVSIFIKLRSYTPTTLFPHSSCNIHIDGNMLATQSPVLNVFGLEYWCLCMSWYD
jgi:hypothetical protein